MHEMMFQAGAKQNERARRAHSLYVISLIFFIAWKTIIRLSLANEYGEHRTFHLIQECGYIFVCVLCTNNSAPPCIRKSLATPQQ